MVALVETSAVVDLELSLLFDDLETEVSLVVADLVLADLSVVVVLVTGAVVVVVVLIFAPLTGAMSVFTDYGASKSTQLGTVTSLGCGPFPPSVLVI